MEQGQTVAPDFIDRSVKITLKIDCEFPEKVVFCGLPLIEACKELPERISFKDSIITITEEI